MLTKDENKTHTLPVIIAATEDKSWKVRLALANNFCGVKIYIFQINYQIKVGRSIWQRNY